ncbi:hypothetical protein [Sphingomonas sp. LY160]|uniref:hypothetical protein n=1 Tax=Sphingomonas sp. LY160 TaxID=3095342 RepID=UPI002ADEB006|nr:hypothetical protein [Sphingomonas sp. LY160]MEA1071642.1 hypothetical protein [Sphingomonas sp. LY160]
MLGVLLAIWLGWKLLHPVHTYRFRLTVEAEKNGAKHSGSSVIELRTRRNFFLSMLPEVPEWETSVRGEAVFVDMGGDDHLIAIITGPNAPKITASLPSRVVLGDAKARVGPPGVLDTLSTLHPHALRQAYGPSYALSREQMPPLIRFARRNDPTAVETVTPEDYAVNARLELTNDDVTRSIANHLPWLNGMQSDSNLSGNGTGVFTAGEELYSKPSHLTASNFIARH